MSTKDAVAGLFGLKGEAWMRHANPASVWTRFAIVPLLAVAIWSRDWIGWWCLVPVVALLVWTVANPLFFDRPASTKHWASRAVFGERLWTERDRASLPEEFRSPVPNIAQASQLVGLVALAVGLVTDDVAATVGGVVIMQLGKCWYLDRMVLLFDAVKAHDSEAAAWEY
jgi:hypothetical protein